MTLSVPCDPQRLRQLLSDSLPDAEEESLLDHLSGCHNCQCELESLAATKEWWSEAIQRLHSTVDDADGLDDESVRFANDFAVDFLRPSDDPASLGRLGEYEIMEVIGRGGMGIVLKGYQKELHRHVAVKVLSPHLATSGAARRRFSREAQATAAVVHPHVMAIHSVNANEKLPYLVMPFVPCQSLQERLDTHGPLELKDVLRIGSQAACGLAAAHAQGLVHRDVKPANILLETNVDRVLLTDFGLARAVDDATLTRTGVIAGTPQYMSPEQAGGDAVDHRSDLFSLGSVLYAMCTGRPPFRAETTFGVLRRIRETSPRRIREINPDVPEWLERIVFKLLEKTSTDRLESAQDIATLLERCLAHVQQPTTVPLPDSIGGWQLVQPVADPASGQWFRGPLRSMHAVAGAATVLTLVMCWWLFWGKNSASHQKQDGEPQTKVVDPAETISPTPADVPLDWQATQTELNDAALNIRAIDESMKNDLESVPSDPGSEPE